MNSKFKGIIFMILASAAFATMNLLSKLAVGVNSYQKLFDKCCSNLNSLLYNSL